MKKFQKAKASFLKTQKSRVKDTAKKLPGYNSPYEKREKEERDEDEDWRTNIHWRRDILLGRLKKSDVDAEDNPEAQATGELAETREDKEDNRNQNPPSEYDHAEEDGAVAWKDKGKWKATSESANSEEAEEEDIHDHQSDETESEVSPDHANNVNTVDSKDEEEVKAIDDLAESKYASRHIHDQSRSEPKSDPSDHHTKKDGGMD